MVEIFSYYHNAEMVEITIKPDQGKVKKMILFKILIFKNLFRFFPTFSHLSKQKNGFTGFTAFNESLTLLPT